MSIKKIVVFLLNFTKKDILEQVIQIQNGRIKQGDNTILDQINLEVHSNDFIFLIGKTGTGKSSLLKCLYGELPLFEGKGTVVGYDLQNLPKNDIPFLRRKIGIVFQDFQLLTDRTVQDNLYFVMGATGWKDKLLIQKRAKEVLQLVGLETKMNAMPNMLSGGEQQRVAIARALINHPKIILADEPTGNLDPETSAEIMHLLIAIAKEEKTAVIMATHDMGMVTQFAGKILRVEGKKLIEVNRN